MPRIALQQREKRCVQYSARAAFGHPEVTAVNLFSRRRAEASAFIIVRPPTLSTVVPKALL